MHNFFQRLCILAALLITNAFATSINHFYLDSETVWINGHNGLKTNPDMTLGEAVWRGERISLSIDKERPGHLMWKLSNEHTDDTKPAPGDIISVSVSGQNVFRGYCHNTPFAPMHGVIEGILQLDPDGGLPTD